MCIREKKKLWILVSSVCHSCVWVFWLQHRKRPLPIIVCCYIKSPTVRVGSHWMNIWRNFFELIPVNTISFLQSFFWHAGTPQSVLAWFSSDQITIEFIFGPTIKRYDIKTTMHPYLRFNLGYIDTQAFIPIPALPDAREEVMLWQKQGLYHSFMKCDT